MDEIDRMQELEGVILEAAISRAARPAPMFDGRAARPGDCRDCGKPIAPARLRALPGCRRCIDCQREAEEG